MRRLAAALAFALALTAPGLPSYQAAAEVLASASGAGQARARAVGPTAAGIATDSPISGALALPNNLGGLSPVGGALVEPMNSPSLSPEAFPSAEIANIQEDVHDSPQTVEGTSDAFSASESLQAGRALTPAAKAVGALGENMAGTGMLKSETAGPAARSFFDRASLSGVDGVVIVGVLGAVGLAKAVARIRASWRRSPSAVQRPIAISDHGDERLIVDSRSLPSRRKGGFLGKVGPPLLRAPLWLLGIFSLGAGLYLYPAVLDTLGNYLSTGMTQRLDDATKAYNHGNLGLAFLTVVAFPAYLISNGAGFFFPILQMGKVFKNRSSDVSATKLATGMVSSFILAFNFSFSGALLAAYQNLFGGLIFTFIIGQSFWYRGPSAPDDSRNSVWNKISLGAAAMVALTYAIGQGFLLGVPLLPVAAIIVPLQMFAALGFSYLMLPEYLKIEREKSVGDASLGMAWMYLTCIGMAGVWTLYELIKIPAGSAAVSLTAFTMILAAVTPWTMISLRWVGQRQWRFLSAKLGKERGADLGSFLALGILMLAMVGLSQYALRSLLYIPASSTNFLPYLFYLIGNVVTDVATGLNLVAFYKYSRKPSKN